VIVFKKNAEAALSAKCPYTFYAT